MFRKCRIAADGTRLPEGSGSPSLSQKSSNSTLVAKINVGDRKQSVLGADLVLEGVSVH